MVKVKEDMTGWVMSEHGVPDSRLKVIKQIEDHVYPSGVHTARWICECLCEEHNMIEVIGKSIRNGNTKSCGCLEHESKCMSKNKKYNKYDLSGEYGVGYTENGDEFWFDIEDYNLIKDYCWHIHHGYVEAREDDYAISMHRLVLGLDKDDNRKVDHIKHNKFDNRKKYLRICEHIDNCKNKVLSKNNASGYKGVVWHSRDSIWEAYITVNKNKIYLGRFSNKLEAVKARKRAEEKYFKDFSYDYSMSFDAV